MFHQWRNISDTVPNHIWIWLNMIEYVWLTWVCMYRIMMNYVDRYVICNRMYCKYVCVNIYYRICIHVHWGAWCRFQRLESRSRSGITSAYSSECSRGTHCSVYHVRDSSKPLAFVASIEQTFLIGFPSKLSNCWTRFRRWTILVCQKMRDVQKWWMPKRAVSMGKWWSTVGQPSNFGATYSTLDLATKSNIG